MKKVKFHGYQKDIETYYNQSKITILASEREGLARAMIESLASGTPVISFDVCSANEFLNNYDCGFVIKQGDYARMAKKIDKLINDDALLSRMSLNAENAVDQKLQVGKIISQYEKVYLN